MQNDIDVIRKLSSFKLSAIYYQQVDNCLELSGIQLEFTNGMKTPMFCFASKEASSEQIQQTKRIKVNTNETISAIRLKVA